MKMILATMVLAATVAAALDIPVDVATGERITTIKVAVTPGAPLVSPVIRADGLTDWLLTVPLVALNQYGRPVEHRALVDALQGVRVSHEECVAVGEAIKVDYAKAAGRERVQPVLVAMLGKLAAGLGVVPEQRAEWVARVGAQVQAAWASAK